MAYIIKYIFLTRGLFINNGLYQIEHNFKNEYDKRKMSLLIFSVRSVLQVNIATTNGV